MTKRTRQCLHCKKRFQINGHGRPQLYCSRSHRERAYEKRKLSEIQRPTERTYRLLIRDLEIVSRQRTKWSGLPGKINWLDPEVYGPAAYRRAIARVRGTLGRLVPEILGERRVASGGVLVGDVLQKSTQAYRKLCWKYHPDRGGAETSKSVDQILNEVMKDINDFWDRVTGDVAAAKQR